MKRQFSLSVLLSLLVFTSTVLQCQELIVQTDAGKQNPESRRS